MISSPTNIYTTLVRFEPDDGMVYPVDTIWHAHKSWLVPAWTEHSPGEWQYPARIIFPKEGRFLFSRPQADFVLSYCRMPRSLFDGQSQPPAGNPFVVIETPDIRVYYEVGQMVQEVLKRLQTESHPISLHKLTG